MPDPVMMPTDIRSDPTGSTRPDSRPDAEKEAETAGGREAETTRDQWAVLYDSDCGFCRWSLARLLDWDRDRRLRPVALGTEEADRLLAELTPEQRAASWHLISPSGERTSGGIASVPLLQLLPGGAAPARVLGTMPTVTDRAYQWVADHRSWFSRAIPAAAKQRADERIASR